MDSNALKRSLKDIVREDLGSGDVTTAFTPRKRIRAVVIAKEGGFLSGLSEIKALFRIYGVKAKSRFKDGGKVRTGDVVLKLDGDSSKMLPIIRSALNILSKMSGITTQTRQYVDAISKINPRARILATRKTTPNFRYFEKKAVKIGGGLPHRMGLYDMVLIKHEHIKLFSGDVGKAVSAAKKSDKKYKIEVEVGNTKDAVTAAKSRPDVIMLDNMGPKGVRSTIRALTRLGLRRNVKIEASGRVNMANILEYAKSGVDYISLGSLTHSVKSLDFSMKIVD